MSHVKLAPYRPNTPPKLPGSEIRWMEDELRKLQATVAALIAAIEELRALHP